MDWSPVIGLAGNIASGIMGMSNASDAADTAYHRQKEFMLAQDQYNVKNFRNRYQWTVQDMRSAGLNPILAATQGIGGNVTGVGLPSAPQAALPSTPDFAGTFNSARQISQQKEIAKMQNDVAKEELRLKELDINSSIDQRKNDIALSNGRFQLEKWTAQENIRLKEVMQDAQIKNMVERLQADIEHMARQDANGAVAAAAAMAHANASGLMASIQDRLSISREEMMDAQEAYLALQSANAEESLKWQRWLNDHPYTRGAVGLIGSVFDTAGLAAKIYKPVYGAVSSGGSSPGYTYSDDDYESWIR